MLALLGVEWFAELMEQPADRTSLQQYDVDDEVLARWRGEHFGRSGSCGRCLL